MTTQLNRDIGRIEGKIDAILDNQNEFKATFEKHDNRLKHLENHQMKTLGAFGVIIFVFNRIWDFVKDKIHS
jgi:hypothetical protein